MMSLTIPVRVVTSVLLVPVVFELSKEAELKGNPIKFINSPLMISTLYLSRCSCDQDTLKRLHQVCQVSRLSNLILTRKYLMIETGSKLNKKIYRKYLVSQQWFC